MQEALLEISREKNRSNQHMRSGRRGMFTFSIASVKIIMANSKEATQAVQKEVNQWVDNSHSICITLNWVMHSVRLSTVIYKVQLTNTSQFYVHFVDIFLSCVHPLDRGRGGG